MLPVGDKRGWQVTEDVGNAACMEESIWEGVQGIFVFCFVLKLWHLLGLIGTHVSRYSVSGYSSGTDSVVAAFRFLRGQELESLSRLWYDI